MLRSILGRKLEATLGFKFSLKVSVVGELRLRVGAKTRNIRSWLD